MRNYLEEKLLNGETGSIIYIIIQEQRDNNAFVLFSR